MAPFPIERANVLGVGVSAIDLEIACSAVDDWIGKREQHYVCVTGIHGVVECRRDESLRTIHNRAGLVTPDGMPLVWLSRLQGFRDVSRVYGPDLMLRVCKRSVERGYKHYLYGGAEGVPQLLVKRLSEKLPGLDIVGCYSPPFHPPTLGEQVATANRINESGADIVWVGLGTPKQERWMASQIGRLEAPVLIGVGAAFDFLSGLKPQAPVWMQRSGFEWLFRMLSEPRRLAPRYLVSGPQFLWFLLLHALRIGRKTMS